MERVGGYITTNVDMTDTYKFGEALKFTLAHEGGYSFNPNDPGGETKWGISKRYHPNVDIKNLTQQQAYDIYLNEYWNPIGGDNLPYPLCVVAFDTAVNPGLGDALKWLKLSQGQTWTGLLQLRRNNYQNLVSSNPSKRVDLKGWLNRCNDLQKYCEIAEIQNNIN